VHHCVILELNVPSYRAEQARKATQAKKAEDAKKASEPASLSDRQIRVDSQPQLGQQVEGVERLGERRP